jgi:hypothetical protein
MALSSTLSHLAIGLADGTVFLYRHLDQFIFSGSNALTSLPKSRVVHESPTEPITGLGFKEPSAEDTDNTNLYLFVVTTNQVLSYQATGKGSGNTATAVDEVGSALGCATMDWKVKDMVVARDEALYIIGTEGRGACYAYEGSSFSEFLSSHLRCMHRTQVLCSHTSQLSHHSVTSFHPQSILCFCHRPQFCRAKHWRY